MSPPYRGFGESAGTILYEHCCHWVIGLSNLQVAVKALKRSDAPYLVIRNRLLKSCRVWLELEHRNIVHFYGMISGFSVFPALVIAWMRNGTLTEYLDKQYPYLTISRRFCLVRVSVTAVLHMLMDGVIQVNDVASGLSYRPCSLFFFYFLSGLTCWF